MRVVVSGAGGFLGRAAVRALAGAGHQVVGLIRAEGSASLVRTDGGTPVVADVRNPAELQKPLQGADVVIHLAQSGEGSLQDRREVRVQGGRNLAQAAVATGVRRVVVGSGYWVYASSPDPIAEASLLAPRSISLVNLETEQAVRAEALPGGVEVIVARPGMVYGPGSWFADMVRELGEGTYRYIAEGANRLSPVRLQDAGEAFCVLAERGSPGTVYLVVDDLPVATRVLAEYVSERIGGRPPVAIPKDEAIRAWGEDLAELNVADRAASNARLRALGWVPRAATYREGMPEVISALLGMGPERQPVH